MYPAMDKFVSKRGITHAAKLEPPPKLPDIMPPKMHKRKAQMKDETDKQIVRTTTGKTNHTPDHVYNLSNIPSGEDTTPQIFLQD